MSLSIEEIADKHLKKITDQQLNSLPLKQVEPDMADPDQDPTEEWKYWHPVPARVTDQEITDLEMKIGHPLPGSYKRLLRHKHFYELVISEAAFCRHISNDWQNGLLNMIFDGYPRMFLIDRGYIPFADYSDWGLLCFNTHHKQPGNEYEIVLWDHEAWDEFQYKYKNFTEMMEALDKEAS